MMRSLLGWKAYTQLWPLALLAGATATACSLSGCNRSANPDGSGVPTTSPASARLVEIDGGVDETRHNYQWTVINRYSSPIVSVSFPHYHADMFFPPHGWTAERSTFLVNVGVPDKPGVCIAESESQDAAIPSGGRRDFGMRIAAGGALVGKGTVRIEFKDGTKAEVADVVLPVPPPYSFKMLPLVGAAIIFGAWVAVRTIRERRRSSTQQAAGPRSPDGGQDAVN